MTTTVPMSVLTGVAEPARARWAPLRAGIVNLFRYDQQTFTFHRGRLLIRGNNGSGKSMALEVLLPFVLDADLTPSRLSTFGGNNRNMYLWLIGFDKTGTRTSERAYVWVEFGRRLVDGSCEYFTAGAMVEGTRGGDVKPTYFTSAARIGVHLSVGGPGREPLNKNALAQLLGEQADAGRAGKVHPDARSHRAAVNDALYQLPDKRFDALRATLRQLRRPKLSDKLDEAGLDQVLRDSLPPVLDATVADLAEGFERLDRHGAAVTELDTTIEHLHSLRETYRRYARLAVAARADAVAAAETGIEAVRDRAAAAQADSDTAARQLRAIETRRAQIADRNARIEGRTSALRDKEAFREGQDLEPLRLLVAKLMTTAGLTSERARRSQARTEADASTSERRHAQAESAVAELANLRSVAAATTTGAFTANLDSELAATVEGLRAADVADEVALDAVVAAVRQLTGRLETGLTPWSRQVATLVSLDDAARSKHATAAAAHAETERAEADVAVAEQELNVALDADRAAMLTWLEELTAWAASSPQLRAGQAPPLPWEAATAAQRASRWVREAAATRTNTLLARQQALNAAAGQRTAAGRAAQTAADALGGLAEATEAVEASAGARDDAGAAYRAQLLQWGATLIELPPARGVPDWTPVADLDLAAVAREWAGVAASAAAEVLHAAQSHVQRELAPLKEKVTELTAREEHLASGGLPELPVPATRCADRTGRAGAPLYLLVEFADEVPADIRLGVEAAAIGAGVADAWVSPDGRLLTADGGLLHDTQLTVDVPTAHPSLADVLVAADGETVPFDKVTGVLSRIGLVAALDPDVADRADQPGGPGLVLGHDGSWRAGALTGAHHVAEVTLLGAAAREADRLARLAAVRAELATVTTAVDDLAAQVGVLRARLAAVDVERRSVPDDAQLRRAAQAATSAQVAATERAGACAGLLAAAIAPLPPLPAGHDSGQDGDLAAGSAQDEDATAAVAELTRQTGQLVQAVADGRANELGDCGYGPGLRTGAELCAALAAARYASAEAHLAAAAAVRDDLAEVARERDAAPADSAVTEARAALQSTRSALASAGTRLSERSIDERKARDVATQADEACNAGVAGAGMPAGIDLRQLAAAVGRYRAVAESWLRAAAETVRTTGLAALALRASLSSADDASAARREAAEAAAEHATADEQLRAKTENFGADYDTIVDELGRLEQEASRLKEELGRLAAQEREHLVAEATAKSTLDSVAEARAAAEATRAAAHEAFLAAGRLGLLTAAGLAEHAAIPLGPDSPADAGEDGVVEPSPGEAGLGLRAVRTRARAVRDAVGERLVRTPEAVEAAANRVNDRRYELDPLLANGGVSIRDEQRASLTVLHAVRGGRSLLLPEMIDALAEDRNTAANLLAAEERELFRRFLADDTRREVTSKVRDARTQVTQVARLMAAHPTGSGLRVQLRWVPDESNAPGMQEIVKLMAKDAPLESEKERLADFFRARVAQVRANADIDYTAQLAQLLDYRQWWKFVVEYQRGGDTTWTPLTGKAHGALSGGEKAVCLHLPLFAAAASYSDNAPLRAAEPDGSVSPGAPRLILLDEVFAGVDEDNRGELFELIRDLDLDLVATSESERGLYPQLDGLSIYQLYASDTAVLAARTVWDGGAEHNLLEEDLLADLGDDGALFL